MADKVDLRRTIATYRARQGSFDVVEVAEAQFLMIDGHGDPNTDPAYAEALAALYPVAYAMKFASKRDLDRDYTVMPLEGLWWADDHAAFTSARDKSAWDWTMMILTPDWLDQANFEAAVAKAASKPDASPALHRLRLELLAEGRCVQTLHVGPYDDEAPVLARLHDEVIPGLGLTMRGKHHEIYLGDPRRTAPEKLRTILRQPVG